MPLTGTHHVRALKSALRKARRRYRPKARDRMQVRTLTLKLRFWGDRHSPDASEQLLDMSYESIKAMPGSGVWELRVEDEIGGVRNIRVIFFVPPNEWRQIQPTPLPNLWILEAIPKKRDEWTTNDIDRFWALREVVKSRFYK